jgi:hypothetical protein
MDAEGFTLKLDLTGCRHSYVEGSFFKIGGMTAAKCFTCDRVVAWSIETPGSCTRLTWIAEKHQVTQMLPEPASEMLDK